MQILRRLARKKIGPRLLGTFANGRFEQFFHARTLTAKDLRIPETSKHIAKRMRELHDGIELLEEELDEGAFIWRNWDKWKDRCEEVISYLDQQILAGQKGLTTTRSEEWKKRGLVCGVEWSVFRSAVRRYRNWLSEQYGGAEGIRRKLVFAHNDVNCSFISMIYDADGHLRHSTGIFFALSQAESRLCCCLRTSISN